MHCDLGKNHIWTLAVVSRTSCALSTVYRSVSVSINTLTRTRQMYSVHTCIFDLMSISLYYKYRLLARRDLLNALITELRKDPDLTLSQYCSSVQVSVAYCIHIALHIKLHLYIVTIFFFFLLNKQRALLLVNINTH